MPRRTSDHRDSLTGSFMHQQRGSGTQHRDGSQRQKTVQQKHAVHIHSHHFKCGTKNDAARLNGY